MRLNEYLASTESEMRGVLLGLGITLNYTNKRKVWLGAGFEVWVGGTRERFRIDLSRGGHRIRVFDHKSGTETACRGNLVLISLKILDKSWKAWELQFGHSWTNTDRDNIYGDYSLHGAHYRPGTSFHGWYVQIRKLFFVKFYPERIAGRGPEKR